MGFFNFGSHGGHHKHGETNIDQIKMTQITPAFVTYCGPNISLYFEICAAMSGSEQNIKQLYIVSTLILGQLQR